MARRNIEKALSDFRKLKHDPIGSTDILQIRDKVLSENGGSVTVANPEVGGVQVCYTGHQFITGIITALEAGYMIGYRAGKR